MLRQYHDKSSTKKKVHWESHFTEKRYWKDDILSTCGHLRIQQSCFFTKYLQAVKTKKKKKVDRHNIFCFSPLALLHTCAFVPVATKWKKREEPTNAENSQCFTRRKLLGSYILLGPKEALEIQKNTTNIGSETFSLPAQCQCRKLIN